MRSYYAHLQTTLPSEGAISPKSIFRSSAIFPVIHSSLLKSRLLFLGYWMLKRHIKEIGCVVSLRNLKGAILSRRFLQIQEAKSFRFEVEEELQRAAEQFEDSNFFLGS